MPLIGHWPLQEDSGSTAYDFAGSNDGEVNGASMGKDGVLKGSAYKFDGSSDVKVNNPADGLEAMSAALWAFDGDFSGALFHGYYQFEISKSVRFKIGDSSGWHFSETGISAPPTGWNHYALTWDGTNVSCYLNGDKVSSGQANISDLGTRTEEQTIGAFADGNSPIIGKIADVRLYDHAVAPSTIAYIYTSGNAGSLVTGKKQI